MKTRGTKERLFATTLLAGMAAILGATPAMAQDAQPPAAADEVEEDEGEAIIVTGSRIRRSEYSSSQPIQVIDANTARSFGSVDTAGLLQDSIAAGGPQIDGSFNSASGGSNATERPPSSGPGSGSVALRGLDEERTLVLLNGRRLAPAGVGGAPTRPDINLLPSSMVERIEVLTGGASAIYGADAVAGVVNIITRQNFDGLELQAYRSQPEDGGGEISQLNFITGAQGDRGNVMFAAEFYERNRIQVGDRDYAHCASLMLDVYSGPTVASPGTVVDQVDTCYSTFFDNNMIVGGGTLMFFGPGQPADTVGGIFTGAPGWTRTPFGSVVGITAVDRVTWRFDDSPHRPGGSFGEYNQNDEALSADLQAPLRRFAFYSQGAFDLGVDLGASSPEIYYEMFYSNRQTRSQATPEQTEPFIPHQIPRLDNDGNGDAILDAGEDDDGDGDGEDLDDWDRDADGDIIYYDNPLSPFDDETVQGLLIMDDDNDQIRRTEVEQIRFSGGVRGDFGDLGPIRNFGYDIFGTYDRTLGFLSQQILFEPNVIAGTNWAFLDGTGATAADDNVTCGVEPTRTNTDFLDLTFASDFDLVSPALNGNGKCVPINWFAPSVLDPTTGTGSRFATREEADFLHANRINRTIVEQSVFGAGFTGELWDLQGGAIAFAAGLEHRIDQIQSINDVVVERGLQATEVSQSEGSASGTTYQNDAYLEVELPLAADRPLFEELTLNLAVRYTSEKNFGNATTYSARGLWSPTDWLSLRGTFSTAFRAPNLREQFLSNNASGTIGSATDPCYVPGLARLPTSPPSYDPTPGVDLRSPALLAACIASGADPFALGLDGFSIAIPTFASGTTALDPETAESLSAGFVLTNRWIDWFDADLAVTYWTTEVTDTVEELDATSVIFGCFFSTAAPFTDPLCSRIARSSTGNPRVDFLASVETSFRNVGVIEVEGADINFRLSKDFGDFLFSFNSANSYLMSLSRQTDAEDESTREQFAGAQLQSRLLSNNTFTVGWGDFTVGLRSNFTEGTVGRRRDELSASFIFLSQTTCGYPASGFSATPVATVCRDRGYLVPDYWKHDVMLNYANDDWSFTVGVNNVTDEEPPRVSSRLSDFQERNSVVTGSNYDLYGRTVFANVRRTF